MALTAVVADPAEACELPLCSPSLDAFRFEQTPAKADRSEMDNAVRQCEGGSIDTSASGVEQSEVGVWTAVGEPARE